VRTVQELEANVADFDKEIPNQLWTELEDLGLIAPAHK
jgi:hypothetical protein